MGQDQKHPSLPQPPPDADVDAAAADDARPSSPPRPPSAPFDPSRMIGIIKRKALIKNLAAVYHAECLAYCQELLELQKNFEEPFVEAKTPDDTRKEAMRPPKRLKKTR
ncbi:uncharacterized protein [Euphorbia lathyris]|uniref:uncharacterized protein n=1 Tax=Euphorbia lathyris TaxID=212925 RepID=UPI0033137D49